LIFQNDLQKQIIIMYPINNQSPPELQATKAHCRSIFQIPTDYTFAFFIFVIVATLPLLFFILVSLHNSHVITFLYSGGILATLWILYFGLKANVRWIFWASFAGSFAVWSLLLWQTIRRVRFMLENGGMEPADGYGSPMAFLIGIVMEQWFFIPLNFVVFCGIAGLLNGKRRYR